MNYLSEIVMYFETFEKLLNLPDTARVVAVTESDAQLKMVKIRVISENEPVEADAQELSKIGDSFRNVGGTTIAAGNKLPVIEVK